MRLLVAVLACLVVPALCQAQAPADAAPASGSPAAALLLAELSDEPVPPSPIVVHVDPEFRGFGSALVRSLARRVDGEITLGEPSVELSLELSPGHVRIAPTEAHDHAFATVTLMGEGGRVFETEVGLPRQRAAAVRALALAVLDLRDASLAAPPAEAPVIAAGEVAPTVTSSSGSDYVYLAPEGGLFGRRRTIEALARPTIYFRALLGYSTAQQAFLVGPGIGFGLCLGDNCVVIEGDLPILEERRMSSESTAISYRAVNLALRLQWRPIRIDSVTVGVTVGLLSRIGGAWQPDGTTAVVSSFGTRQSLEIAWTIERPFEWVIEGGADVAITPARYIQSSTVITPLEDMVTVWGLTALRVRP